MIIKVFIPTYKRLNSLQAVIYSLIKTNIPDISFVYKCYVVNNFPENKDVVNKLVLVFNKKSDTWKIEAIHREKTVPPITNWYSAISDYTNDGEIAFLQGDDDLFLPDSILYRVNTILKENANLLLTTHTGGIFFYDNTNDISINGFQLDKNKVESIRSVEFSDNKWSAIFIGNNTYRMTPMLRKAFQKSMEWCDDQDWLTYDMRTLMYPIYIPVALIYLGGKVVSSEKECVIRSMNIDECRRALWGVPGWNSGFLHIAFLGVLNNSELSSFRQLNSDRKATNDIAALCYWTFFLDPRISNEVRVETFIRIGKPMFTFKTLRGSLVFLTKGLLSQFKLFNQLKDRLKPKRKMIDPKVFIDNLYS